MLCELSMKKFYNLRAWPACAFTQSDQHLCWSFLLEYNIIVYSDSHNAIMFIWQNIDLPGKNTIFKIILVSYDKQNLTVMSYYIS